MNLHHQNLQYDEAMQVTAPAQDPSKRKFLSNHTLRSKHAFFRADQTILPYHS